MLKGEYIIVKSQEKDKRIVVDSKKNTIELYENNNLIKTIDEMYLGRGGVTSSKKEGDDCTPLGTYNLGFAFGINELDINYPYYIIDSNIYWVDDVNSKYYNCWVSVGEDVRSSYDYMCSVKDIYWNSAEHLIDYPIYYEYGLVIEYNVEKIPGKGSAIFTHIKDCPTAGCIATNREAMLFILNWIDKKTIIEIK